MKAMHMIAFILTIIGGLNWGLIGLGRLMGGSGWNVVNMVLGSIPTLEALVYLLVGLAAVWLAVNHKKDCKWCSAGSMSSPNPMM